MENDVFQGAVLLNLTCSLPGNTKKVSDERVLAEEDDSPEHSWIGVSKRLISSEEFDAVKTIVGRMKRFLDRKCITSKGTRGNKPALKRFIKNGVYVLPIGLVPEVDAELCTYKTEFAAAVDKFIEVYPVLREQAKANLKSVFDESDYPDTEKLKSAFGIEFAYLNISTPKALEQISAEVYKREQENAQKQWREASQEIKLALRAGLQELVSWMADVLKPTGGRQKAFRGSNVERLIEFCQDFQQKNLLNDQDLSNMVDKVRGLLNGESVENIQKSAKDSDWRTDMAAKFEEVKQELAPLVEEAAERMIILED